MSAKNVTWERGLQQQVHSIVDYTSNKEHFVEESSVT